MLLVLSYKDPSTALVTEVSLETEHTVKVGNFLTATSSNANRTLLAFPPDGS